MAAQWPLEGTVDLTPFEAAVERAAQLAETLGVEHPETREALAVADAARYGVQVRSQHPLVIHQAA